MKESREMRKTRRRNCMFNHDWLRRDQFADWLRSVPGERHRAYCALCQRSFSVGHGGLHDVSVHRGGKRHLMLEKHQSPSNRNSTTKCIDEDMDQSEEKSQSDQELEELSSGPLTDQPNDPTAFEELTSSSCQQEAQFGKLISVRTLSGQNLESPCEHKSGPELSERQADGPSTGCDIQMLQNPQPSVGSTSGPAATPPASSNSMYPQHYCLRWKYHHNNLQNMFSQLLERQAYCDVTLASEGKTLRAHKVVLSACSTYFDTILSQYEEKDPIVIMRDVKFSDIKVLVEFMYKGEINIDHSRLSSLLKTAEDLHIKGLAEVSWRNDVGQNDVSNRGQSPGSTPGVEAVLREGDSEDIPVPNKRRRGRPPLDDTPSAHDVFTPKITCITGNEDLSEGDHESWDDDIGTQDRPDSPANVESPYLSKDDSMMDHERRGLIIVPNTPTQPPGPPGSNSNAMNLGIPEQFRDVIKMNDYLTTGRRQEFWEEPFTRRVMDAIKSKELEMKTAAEILGVSYGTLYGRYRDSYGCLKHPYRVRDFWSEPGPCEILMKLRRKEITLFRAAECLNVTVHTLATYLSTLQGADRISFTPDINMSSLPHDLGNSNDQMDNDAIASASMLLERINAGAASPIAPSVSATSIKREGGGYVEIPPVGGTVPKSNSGSVLEHNPDITIVKAESMNRSNSGKYTKFPSAENNNAKLMSGGAVSELQAQHHIATNLSQIQIHPVSQSNSGLSPQIHHQQQLSPQQQSSNSLANDGNKP